MKKVVFCSLLVCWVTIATAQEEPGKDYSDPKLTEVWEPRPEIVTPAKQAGAAPSDAIVLFDGNSLDNWIMSADGSPCAWRLEDRTLVAAGRTGDIQTRQAFGDCQLHIEFLIPADANKSEHPYNAGNSGVYLQERYEVQIFDSYRNRTKIYANGQCGSLYKQAPPLVNACSEPGSWNTYDIYYTAPVFRNNGSVKQPAYLTVVHNGVLILNHAEIQGATVHSGISRYEPHGKAALKLQEHGSEVRFRNIWIREL